jgi:diguanylate cyclase (GGDEF)-like protein
MPRVGLFSRRSYAALLARLVWPTAILFAVTLCIVFATILWTSERANKAAVERQSVQLTAAFEQKLADLSDRLWQLAGTPGFLEGWRHGASSDPTFGRVGQRPAHPFEFSGIFVVDNSSRVVSGMVDGASAGQLTYDQMRPLIEHVVDAAHRKLAIAAQLPQSGGRPPFLYRELGVSRLLHDGRTTYAVVALPLAPGAMRAREPAVAVAYKRIGETELKKLAELHVMEDFEVTTRAPRHGGWLPLHDGTGRTTAYLSWKPERPGDLMRERLVPLTLFGSVVAAVLFCFLVIYIRWIARDLARSEEKAKSLLGRDPLSGLPNRLLFGERLDDELERVATNGGGLAVLFLDLDRFKDVNDTYGHQAGDELIKVAAKRLEAMLRDSDTLARFGGDEFAVIQPSVTTPSDAETLARRILDTLTTPFEIADAQIQVGVSIGIALAPQHGTDRESLMRLADTALYQAKSEGRNRYSMFQRRMDETIRMRKIVEDDLRHAIVNDGLVLHYQPLYSADGESIVGLEALVRWPHPTKGMIPPGSFISLAEERGLVIQLGEWVLRRACMDGRRWPGLRIAVNVSPVQFRHRGFVGSVVNALEDTGFDPSRLELELTEGVVVEDADAAEAAMMELRGMGVHLALDDFGTGYSSLIYLRRFAFDKIKIDRSFLESMEATGESAILVHSIVHLGRALGLTVTAEGVETTEQHRFLQALGCHELQGYLFSKPVPAEEIDRILRRQADKAVGATAA